VLEAVVDHQVLPLGPPRDHVRYPQARPGLGRAGTAARWLTLAHARRGHSQPEVGPDPGVGGPSVGQDAAAGPQGAELHLPPEGERERDAVEQSVKCCDEAITVNRTDRLTWSGQPIRIQNR